MRCSHFASSSIISNMKRNLVLSILFCCSLVVAAQKVVYLPTHDSDTTRQERVGRYGEIYDITHPRLDLYLPAASSEPRMALLVCPGGAYEYVSVSNEGRAVAQWAMQHNIVVAVLKYRLPAGREDVPLEDAQAAMLMLRDSAEQWHIDQQRIGVMGFSAGGHLAGSLLTKYASAQSRPDFGVLIYPVLSMQDDTHKKTRRLLLGEDFTPQQVARWDLKRSVDTNTPPCFIAACQDDKAVPVSNSIDFYTALTRVGVSAELLIMPTGGHGWGFEREIPQTALFRQALLQWLSELR